MSKRFLGFVVAVAVGGATVLVAPVLKGQAPPAGQGPGAGAPAGAPGGAPGGAQRGGAGRGGAGGGQRAAAAPAGPVRRTADGKPDFNGAWSVRGGLANISANLVEPADKAAMGNAPGTEKIPYTPVYKQLRAESPKRMYEEPELHCYMSGPPSHMWRQSYNGAGLVIQQTPDHIALMSEFMGAVRIVPLNKRPHIPENIKLFMGDGVGWWEGDTLVIETRNFNGITWLDNDGDRHSDALTLVERFTLTNENAGTFEATFTDPKAYTQPWKISTTMTRNNNANAEIMEFACIEGNRDHLVYTEAVGGRAKEAPIAAPAEFITPGGGRGGRGGGGAAGGARGGPAGGAAPGGAPATRGQQ